MVNDKAAAREAAGGAAPEAGSSANGQSVAKAKRKAKEVLGERKSERVRGKVARDVTTPERKGRKPGKGKGKGKGKKAAAAADDAADTKTDTAAAAGDAAGAAADGSAAAAAAASPSPKRGKGKGKGKKAAAAAAGAESPTGQSKRKSRGGSGDGPAAKKGKAELTGATAADVSAAYVAAAKARGNKYDVILCDIEGTTTPISFVKVMLFPYIEKQLTAYLSANWEQPQTQADVQALVELAAADVKAGTAGVVPIAAELKGAELRAAVVANVAWQMALNRKSTALKQLQGHMWRAAYESGEVKGQLFPDVAANFFRWIARGLKVAIYSSGSIEAQKLLFGFSENAAQPDLTPILSGYFDTTSGAKVESASYGTIAAALGVPPARILFLTDLHAEAVAAKAAGCGTCVMLRPENAPLPADHGFTTAPDFDAVDELTYANPAPAAAPAAVAAAAAAAAP